MAKVESVIIYPIKAFDGIKIESSTISSGGALLHDRRFAFVNDEEMYVNGKQYSRVHFVRTSFDLSTMQVEFHLSDIGERYRFHLLNDTDAIEKVFSEYFSIRVHFIEDNENGFPDDEKAWGPTIVSLASIDEVNNWFPGLNRDDVIRRFRPNIIIDDVPAFWEDKLFGNAGEEILFQIGEVDLLGVNPCQRCVVPSRNPENAETYDKFKITFAKQRERTLPQWVNKSRFNHFYRFCVNTRISFSEAGKQIRIKDAVTVTGNINLL